MTLRQQADLAIPFIAGIAGTLVPIVVFVGIGLSLQTASWFSWTSNALSDLGMSAPSAALFNNSVIVAGVFLFIFAFGVRRVLPRFTSLSLLAASGAFIGIGLVPETIFVPHWMLSVCFFICFVGCFFGCGLRKSLVPWLRWSGLLLGVLAISSLVLVVLLPGVAIPESLVVVPGFVWCAGVAVGALMLPALAQKKTRKYSTPAMTG